jgi:hypothetical protein
MSLTQWTEFSILAGAAGALALVVGGCDTLECGEGTLEEGGVCVPADGVSPSGSDCPDGTHFNPALLACEDDLPPTECGPNTAAEVDPITGHVICVGTGGEGCTGPIACPSPDGTKVSVCGQIYDIETGLPFQDGTGEDSASCDPTNPTTDGPCSLNIGMYDPLMFAADPTGTPPLAVDTITIDKCGRFSSINVTRPFNGFMAVAVNDASADGTFMPEGGVQDIYTNTGIAFPVAPGEKRAGMEAAVTKRTTDDMWTTTAGNPFGALTFSAKGVYLAVFTYQGQPVSGVTITGGGVSQSGDDYYFADSDTGTNRRTVDSSKSATGPNGTGLLTNSGLRMHSGTGAEPAGCEWPSDLAAAIGDVVFFQERPAHVTGDPETDCP